MTRTVMAGYVKVGDQIRDENQPPFPGRTARQQRLSGGAFSTVIERKSFRNGTRVWFRLENGSERTFCASTDLVINEMAGSKGPALQSIAQGV